MWADVETDQDFLNFRVMAGLAAEMIIDAKGKSLSIGVSGGWGVGKSSMIKLIENELKARNADKLVFLTFNAWLYQGHDDAKAALMEEISRALLVRAEGDDGLISRIKDGIARVNLLRLGRVGLEVGASLALGFPVSPLTKGAEALWDHFTDGDISAEDIKEAKQFGNDHKDEAKALIRPKKTPESPPKMIHALREHFKGLLRDLDVTLVVFVDDLDRCLPPTVIGTLEAMRLFLFLERTAFVIAADDKMIKEAVRIHFKDARLEDDLVVNYFDKLIQVPLRVPPLGANEIRAYLILLFVENSNLEPEVKATVRAGVNDRLTQSWKGESVNGDFAAGLIKDCPMALKAQFAMGDRLAKQMATSRRIAGNPRLIKRFLNTLSIRSKLAGLQSIPVDDAVLAKILLFERCATPASFDLLVQSVNNAGTGKPAILRAAEKAAREGIEMTGDGLDAWLADKVFVTEWLKLDPPLGDVDLRGALHVGRESLPIITAEGRISKDAQDVLNEVFALRLKAGADLSERFGRLIPDERTYIMDKLIERASSEKDWGTPDILWGLSLAAEADPDQAKRLTVFLSNLSSEALSPAIVVRVRGTTWGDATLSEWRERTDLPGPVRNVLTTKPTGSR